mgnify:CR=1 FL=1
MEIKNLEVEMQCWLLRHGMNQAQFGEKVGVSQATISCWMRGIKPHVPYFKMLKEASADCPIVAYWKDKIEA